MPDSEPVVVNLDSMMEIAAGGIVSKTVVEKPYGEVSLFTMAKGQSMWAIQDWRSRDFPSSHHMTSGLGFRLMTGSVFHPSPRTTLGDLATLPMSS